MIRILIDDSPDYQPQMPRPPVGSHVRWHPYPEIAEVTEHTPRGFKYRGAHKLSIPRLQVFGTGEGECFTDMPEWDWQVANRSVELLP